MAGAEAGLAVRGAEAGFPTGEFHVTHARDAVWEKGLRPYFEYRDLGMTGPTGGRVRAQVIRPVNGTSPSDTHHHTLDFQMVYVLQGWALVWFEGIGEIRFEAGSCMYQKPGIVHKVLDYAPDYTVIEITIPADFETTSVAP